MPPISVIDDNIEILETGLAILESLSNPDYNQAFEPWFSASTGKHIRHILDHYLRFFDGLPTGRIDYDGRARDARIETDRPFAVATIRGIQDQLCTLKETLNQANDLAQQPLTVRLCTSTAEPRAKDVASSLERELIFLHGHTTHHYAIIAVILKMLEFPVSADFGVAPSTLVYEEQMECAP